MSGFFPTASISTSAHIAADVEIGPYCVVEAGARIGRGCRLLSHVVIKSGAVLGRNNTIHEGTIIHCDTTLGEHNEVHERSIIGGLPLVCPQPEVCGRLEIGSYNTIRELNTIQRAASQQGVTRIGNHNFMMPSVQIGHDAQVGSHVTITNYSALAGHVILEDHATLGIGVQLHQHVRVGAHAIVGASAYVPRDVPPFVTLDGQSGCVVGLNKVGLKRHGFTTEEIKQLKQAYRLIYRSGSTWEEILHQLQATFSTGPAARFHPFFVSSSRGHCRERRNPAIANLRLHRPSEDASAESCEPLQRCAS